MQVQNGHGVLSRLDPCLKCMKLACQVLNGHFGPVYLLQIRKNEDEERCIYKKRLPKYLIEECGDD